MKIAIPPESWRFEMPTRWTFFGSEGYPRSFSSVTSGLGGLAKVRDLQGFLDVYDRFVSERKSPVSP